MTLKEIKQRKVLKLAMPAVKSLSQFAIRSLQSKIKQYNLKHST
jgi:hypothetical protein